jgi:hypothetical protein
VPVSRLLLEKVPLVALSLLFAAATLWVQLGTEVGGKGEAYPMALRLSNAALAYVKYLANAAWPSRLSVFYPHPGSIHETIPAWQAAGAALLLVLFTWLAFRARKERPWLPVGSGTSGRWFRHSGWSGCPGCRRWRTGTPTFR